MNRAQAIGYLIRNAEELMEVGDLYDEEELKQAVEILKPESKIPKDNLDITFEIEMGMEGEEVFW